ARKRFNSSTSPVERPRVPSCSARSLATQLPRVPALTRGLARPGRSACRYPGRCGPHPPGTPDRTSSVSLAYLLLIVHASMVFGEIHSSQAGLIGGEPGLCCGLNLRAALEVRLVVRGADAA